MLALSAMAQWVCFVHPEPQRYCAAFLLPASRPTRYGVSTLHSRPAGLDPGLALAKIGRIVDEEHPSGSGDGLRCLVYLKKYFWESYHVISYGVND